MQTKIFRGSSHQEVFTKIRNEIGVQALILNINEYQKVEEQGIEITVARQRAKTISSGKQCKTLKSIPTPPAQETKQYTRADKKPQIQAKLAPLLHNNSIVQLTTQQKTIIQLLTQEKVENHIIEQLRGKMLQQPQKPAFRHLQNMLTTQAWGYAHWPQQTHILAGPAGVGKSSMAIRLAQMTRASRPESRICLVNADVSTANRSNLLKQYAQNTNMSYDEILPHNQEKIHKRIQAKEFDLCLIDLPPLEKDKKMAEQIQSLGLENAAYPIHLVLAPHMAQDYLYATLAQYTAAQLSSLIWTKLDEATQYGAILNLGTFAQLPVLAVSYGTALHKVRSASENIVWRVLFKHELPHDTLTAANCIA